MQILTKNHPKCLILYNSVPYFIDLMNNDNILSNYVYRPIPNYLKAIRKITILLKLPIFIWLENWKYKINTFETVIIFAPIKEYSILNFIQKQNKNIRIIYWYWNPIKRVGRLLKSHSQNIEEWSFDQADCLKYKLKFNTTFYFQQIKLLKNNIEYDAVFIGLNKGRKNILKNLESKLTKKGLKTYFHVISNEKYFKNSKNRKLTYHEYLIILSKTKAIIDVIPDGQSGLTLRPMESLFLKKKLITTNVEIKKEIFYNSNNIFIIGLDDENNLIEFINKPFIEDIESIKYFNFQKWLSRFN